MRQSIAEVMSRDHTWEILAAAEQHSAGQQGDDGSDSSTVAVAVGGERRVVGGLMATWITGRVLDGERGA